MLNGSMGFNRSDSPSTSSLSSPPTPRSTKTDRTIGQVMILNRLIYAKKKK